MTYQAPPLDALGNPTRRGILELLADGPKRVGELARFLPVSQPAVSQHLKLLKQAGLVIDRPAGARRLYEVSPAGIEDVRRWLDRFWDKALAAFQAAAEGPEPDTPAAPPPPNRITSRAAASPNERKPNESKEAP
jgi:DNA-binding transcriptional ArsR family regulator